MGSCASATWDMTIDHICILGIGLELACNGGSWGGISLKREKCYLHLKTPRISLSCKLVPVQYREYENGLFSCKILNLDRDIARVLR